MNAHDLATLDLGDEEKRALALEAMRIGYELALVDAAELAEGDASLYAAYAGRERGQAQDIEASFGPGDDLAPQRQRAASFDRDAQTCADLARRIRALKSKPGAKLAPAPKET